MAEETMDKAKQNMEEAAELFAVFYKKLIAEGVPQSIANLMIQELGKQFLSNAFCGSILSQIFKPSSPKEEKN